MLKFMVIVLCHLIIYYPSKVLSSPIIKASGVQWSEPKGSGNGNITLIMIPQNSSCGNDSDVIVAVKSEYQILSQDTQLLNLIVNEDTNTTATSRTTAESEVDRDKLKCPNTARYFQPVNKLVADAVSNNSVNLLYSGKQVNSERESASTVNIFKLLHLEDPNEKMSYSLQTTQNPSTASINGLFQFLTEHNLNHNHLQSTAKAVREDKFETTIHSEDSFYNEALNIMEKLKQDPTYYESIVVKPNPANTSDSGRGSPADRDTKVLRGYQALEGEDTEGYVENEKSKVEEIDPVIAACLSSTITNGQSSVAVSEQHTSVMTNTGESASTETAATTGSVEQSSSANSNQTSLFDIASIVAATAASGSVSFAADHPVALGGREQALSTEICTTVILRCGDVTTGEPSVFHQIVDMVNGTETETTPSTASTVSSVESEATDTTSSTVETKAIDTTTSAVETKAIDTTTSAVETEATGTTTSTVATTMTSNPSEVTVSKSVEARSTVAGEMSNVAAVGETATAISCNVSSTIPQSEKLPRKITLEPRVNCDNLLKMNALTASADARAGGVEAQVKDLSPILDSAVLLVNNNEISEGKDIPLLLNTSMDELSLTDLQDKHEKTHGKAAELYSNDLLFPVIGQLKPVKFSSAESSALKSNGKRRTLLRNRDRGRIIDTDVNRVLKMQFDGNNLVLKQMPAYKYEKNDNYCDSTQKIKNELPHSGLEVSNEEEVESNSEPKVEMPVVKSLPTSKTQEESDYLNERNEQTIKTTSRFDEAHNIKKTFNGKETTKSFFPSESQEIDIDEDQIHTFKENQYKTTNMYTECEDTDKFDADTQSSTKIYNDRRTKQNTVPTKTLTSKSKVLRITEDLLEESPTRCDSLYATKPGRIVTEEVNKRTEFRVTSTTRRTSTTTLGCYYHKDSKEDEGPEEDDKRVEVAGKKDRNQMVDNRETTMNLVDIRTRRPTEDRCPTKSCGQKINIPANSVKEIVIKIIRTTKQPSNIGNTDSDMCYNVEREQNGLKPIFARPSESRKSDYGYQDNFASSDVKHQLEHPAMTDINVEALPQTPIRPSELDPHFSIRSGVLVPQSPMRVEVLDPLTHMNARILNTQSPMREEVYIPQFPIRTGTLDSESRMSAGVLLPKSPMSSGVLDGINQEQYGVQKAPTFDIKNYGFPKQINYQQNLQNRVLMGEMYPEVYKKSELHHPPFIGTHTTPVPESHQYSDLAGTHILLPHHYKSDQAVNSMYNPSIIHGLSDTPEKIVDRNGKSLGSSILKLLLNDKSVIKTV